MRVGEVAEHLLDWYARHGRTLPWRTDRSPYRVVVSEFMLQQTQVERVVPAFERFVAAYSSFGELAAADTGDVVRAWQGLGYNGRAVRLHRLAREVCTQYGGVLPDRLDALLRLPGVGPYTARAIRAFAFDGDEVAADTNVRRVVQRVRFGCDEPAPSARALDAAAVELLPAGHANAMNSALMDLGATICTARTPKCLVCPLRRGCAAFPLDPAALAKRARASAHPGGRVRFEDTTRYLRGRIVDALRSLGPRESISLLDLSSALAGVAPDRSAGEIESATRALERDGLVRIDADGIALPH